MVDERAGTTAATRPDLLTRLRSIVAASGALVGLALLVVALSLLSDNFLTVRNLLNVGVQVSVTAILAFGSTFVIVAGGIDLSVGSLAGFSGIVLGWVVTTAGMPLPVALATALVGGLGLGTVNAAMIAWGKLPPFIATLAMLSIGRGLALVISGGIPLEVPDVLATVGGGELFGAIPYPVLVMLFMGAVTAVILRMTYWGRAMYAIGGNAEAARLSGISVKRQQFVIYGLSGLFSAVAGILLASRLASAQPQGGVGYELDAIAAVVIGGASLAGGVGTAYGTLIGALILGVLRNGLNLLAVSAFWQEVVIGVVIALAVLTDTLRRRAGVSR